MCFNGDNVIKATFEKLIKEYNVKTIVETGTYEGGTTKTLSKMVEQVYTIESNPIYYNKAQQNLLEYKNINLVLGDSSIVLMNLISLNVHKPILFFLDAHWDQYNPVLDELYAISQHFPDSIIAIHDFLVPNTPELGFDYYANNVKIPLCYELIQHMLKHCYSIGYNYFYNKPHEKSSRGIIYICPQ